MAGIVAVGVLLVAGLNQLLFSPAGSSASPLVKTLTDPQPDVDTDRIKRLDDHIKFEFELTAQRVTYLAITESFLFGAYVSALAAFKSAPGQELVYADTLKQLVHAVPWIGVILAAAVVAAVVSAISMIFKLKAQRERLEGSTPGVHPDIGGRSLEHFVGLAPPLVVSVCFLIAWLCVWPPTMKGSQTPNPPQGQEVQVKTKKE